MSDVLSELEAAIKSAAIMRTESVRLAAPIARALAAQIAAKRMTLQYAQQEIADLRERYKADLGHLGELQADNELLREALDGTLKLLEWEGDYDEAMQWRDWQTCDILLDDEGRSPLRDRVIEEARQALTTTAHTSGEHGEVPTRNSGEARND